MRFLKWLFLIVLLAVVGLAAYYFLWPSPERRALSVVPDDAVFIVESRDPIGAYKKIARSPLWQHLMGHEYFKEMNESIRTLDQTLQDNDALFGLIGQRYLTLSIHKTAPRDFDFLYVIDLQRESKLTSLSSQLESALEGTGFTYRETEYHGRKLLQLKDTETNEIVYIGLIDNLIAASYTERLVHNAIDVRDSTSRIQNNPRFKQLREWIDEDKMFNIYINSSELASFLDIYSDEGATPGSMLGSLNGTLDFSGLEMNLEEQEFSLIGKLYLKDSVASYLHAMLATGNGKRHAHEVITQRTGIYTSLCFENFLQTYDQYVALYAANDPEWESYERNIQRVENFLNISVRDDFLSWIGDEIAVVLAQPKLDNRTEDRLLIFHTRDRELAHSRMEHVMKMIRRRTPTRFEDYDYREFTIYEFKVKGFFKLFLGKLFAQFDEPYFTYIEDFVVFATDREALEHFIDDYTANLTLARSDIFNSFDEKFSRKSNVFVYVDNARMTPLMRPFVDGTTWVAMQKNKKYLTAFRQIGMQLTGDGDVFDTRIIVDYSEMEAQDLSLYAEQNQALAEDSTESNAESGDFLLPRDASGNYLVQLPPGLHEEFWGDDQERGLKRRFFVVDGRYDGDYREYYKNRRMRIQGTFDEGRRVGIWYFYKRNGDLIRKETYDQEGNITETSEE